MIASFFISVAAPSFRFGHRSRHHELDRQIQLEYQQLQEENLRLKQQIEEDIKENIIEKDVDFDGTIDEPFLQNEVIVIKKDANFDGDLHEAVPPPPPLPPAPPLRRVTVR